MAANNPRENHQLFQAAVAAADIDALLDLYETDAVMVLPDAHLQGRAALRDFFTAWLSAPADVSLELLQLIERGDTALEKTRCVSADADGGQTVSFSTVVLRRQPDDRWRICIDYPLSD